MHYQFSSTNKSDGTGINATQTTTSQIDIDAIINSVAHSNDLSPSHGHGLNLESSSLLQIAELRYEVKLLADQVSFLLSYVGVTETDPSIVISQDVAPAEVSWPPLTTYNSDIPKQPAPALQRSFKEALVAAVYVDQTKKTGQAANVVITGLPIHQTTSDKTTVTNKLATELDLQVNVVKCKRLGKAVSGKAQPLLVILRSIDEADRVMANAKRLRNSTDTVVRDNVFIDRHLTPAQVRAAYDIRCQRRQAAQPGSSRQPPVYTSSTVLPMESSSSSSTRHRASNPLLNATVPAFQPTSSSSSSSAPPTGSTAAFTSGTIPAAMTLLDAVVPLVASSVPSASIYSPS